MPGGIMARAIDLGGSSSALNSSRTGSARHLCPGGSPAVQSRRTPDAGELPNLKIFQQACDDLIMDGDRVAGVVTQSGIRISGKTVVLTVGTFLNGLIHIGMENYKGPRRGSSLDRPRPAPA